MSNNLELSQADLVEEQELKERLVEECLKLEGYEILDNGEGAFANYHCNGNYRLRKQLEQVQNIIRDYKIVRDRNNQIRWEVFNQNNRFR